MTGFNDISYQRSERRGVQACGECGDLGLMRLGSLVSSEAADVHTWLCAPCLALIWLAAWREGTLPVPCDALCAVTP